MFVVGQRRRDHRDSSHTRERSNGRDGQGQDSGGLISGVADGGCRILLEQGVDGLDAADAVERDVREALTSWQGLAWE